MERTVIIDIPEEVKEFLALPKSIYKNIAFKNLYQKKFQMVSYMTEDGNHYFSSSWGNLHKFRTNYVIKEKEKSGLSYKDGKIHIWFGKELNSIPHIHEFFKIMNWNFIEPDYYHFITKSSLLKLFKGKITNTRDLLKHYLKSIRIDASPELLYQTIKICKAKKEDESKSYMNGQRNLTRGEIYKYCLVAKDPNQFLIRWVTNEKPFRYDDNLSDLVNQFELLNKKVDFKWSENRIKYEHDIATKQLMTIEAENIPYEKIEYPNVELPYGFDLLNTRGEVFAEGETMSHCVYTNYWYSIKNKSYIVFHVTKNGEEATLGCHLTGGVLKYNQVQLKGNKTPSPKMKEFCLKFIEDYKEAFKSTKSDSVSKIEPQVAVQEPDLDFFLNL